MFLLVQRCYCHCIVQGIKYIWMIICLHLDMHSYPMFSSLPGNFISSNFLPKTANISFNPEKIFLEQSLLWICKFFFSLRTGSFCLFSLSCEFQGKVTLLSFQCHWICNSGLLPSQCFETEIVIVFLCCWKKMLRSKFEAKVSFFCRINNYPDIVDCFHMCHKFCENRER